MSNYAEARAAVSEAKQRVATTKRALADFRARMLDTYKDRATLTQCQRNVDRALSDLAYAERALDHAHAVWFATETE